jgi:hypothetical protein
LRGQKRCQITGAVCALHQEKHSPSSCSHLASAGSKGDLPVGGKSCGQQSWSSHWCKQTEFEEWEKAGFFFGILLENDPIPMLFLVNKEGCLIKKRIDKWSVTFN